MVWRRSLNCMDQRVTGGSSSRAPCGHRHLLALTSVRRMHSGRFFYIGRYRLLPVPSTCTRSTPLSLHCPPTATSTHSTIGSVLHQDFASMRIDATARTTAEGIMQLYHSTVAGHESEVERGESRVGVSDDSLREYRVTPVLSRTSEWEVGDATGRRCWGTFPGLASFRSRKGRKNGSRDDLVYPTS